jgi:hypothetical protein
MDYVADRRAAWGPDWAGPVTLTAQEHDRLRTEMGSMSGAQILTIEGVKILIGSVSDLPPVPPVSESALMMKWLEKPLFLAKPVLEPLEHTAYLPLVPDPEPEPMDPTFTNVITGPKKIYTPGQSFAIGAQGPGLLTGIVEPDITAVIGPTTQDDTLWGMPEPGKKPVKVYHKSSSDEHSTPQALFDRLDEEFHFDLDVCATEPHEAPGDPMALKYPDGSVVGHDYECLLDPGNAKCPIYFTKGDDGLKQHWFGRVWMNPPYTKGQVGVWIQKLLKELVVGRITLGVALTAARPDTAWFQVVASYANEIRFLKGRLTFQGQTNAAPFPSVVLVFDPAKKTQLVKFWDWQTGHAPVYWKTPGYTFILGAAGQSGMALPSPKGLLSGPSTLALMK